MRRGNPRALCASASTAGGSNREQFAVGETQGVGEVGVEFLALDVGEVVTHDEALGERLVAGYGESAAQLGESNEQQAQAVLAVHGEDGQKPEVFEDIVAQVLGLVDDEHGECLASHTSRVISSRMAR